MQLHTTNKQKAISRLDLDFVKRRREFSSQEECVIVVVHIMLTKESYKQTCKCKVHEVLFEVLINTCLL